MNITSLIVELLQKGQTVELPEIGTFDSVERAPYHDPVTRIYYPATRNIVYREATVGDDSIVKVIAERDCVNEEVARQMWRNYIDALKDKLKLTGEHRLEGLGSITKVGDKYGFDMDEGVVIEAGNDVNEALADCQAAVEKHGYYHRQVEVLKDAYKGTHELMDNGKASYLEVLTAQETLLNAQLNEATNMYNGAMGIIALYIALGGATH